jgi:hypothetical protein
MTAVVAATVIVWLLSIFLALSAFRCRGVLRKLRRGAAATLFAGLGVLMGSLLILLNSFLAFTAETPVATITTNPLASDTFEMTYTPAPTPNSAMHLNKLARLVWGPAQESMAPIRMTLRGDQWALSGGVVKWHPWLTALGVPSYHRPMRISGQFSDLDRQRAQPPTVYPIGPPIDRFWEAFYRADPYLPFVEAVYGSSAYAYVESMAVQEVYVTPSGYLIKRGTRHRPF